MKAKSAAKPGGLRFGDCLAVALPSVTFDMHLVVLLIERQVVDAFAIAKGNVALDAWICLIERHSLLHQDLEKRRRVVSDRRPLGRVRDQFLHWTTVTLSSLRQIRSRPKSSTPFMMPWYSTAYPRLS